MSAFVWGVSKFSFQQDYQRHISVLKESLCAKEEHYNMLQADVEELRTRLEEKNRLIEKKTQAAVQAVQERNRMSNELTELKDHMDIKDRKINVLQRKVNDMILQYIVHSMYVNDSDDCWSILLFVFGHKKFIVYYATLRCSTFSFNFRFLFVNKLIFVKNELLRKYFNSV